MVTGAEENSFIAFKATMRFSYDRVHNELYQSTVAKEHWKTYPDSHNKAEHCESLTILRYNWVAEWTVHILKWFYHIEPLQKYWKTLLSMSRMRNILLFCYCNMTYDGLTWCFSAVEIRFQSTQAAGKRIKHIIVLFIFLDMQLAGPSTNASLILPYKTL